MALFSRKTNYKRVVEGIARDAFHTDLLAAPGLSDHSADGLMLNALEGLAAVLFLTQRSFLSIGDTVKYEKARDNLAQLLFLELEGSYSKYEMQTLVLPLLEFRHNEYEAILNEGGEPGDRLRTLGSRMIEHFVVETVDQDRANLAILFLFDRLTTEPAKRLKSLDGARKIAW